MPDNTEQDATSASSTETNAATESHSLPDEQVTTSSVDSEAETTTAPAPEKVFAETIERLESGKGPKEAVKVSEAAEEATKDEPAPKEAKEPDALSQELNKAFAERPAWKKVLTLTKPEYRGEMQKAMREVYKEQSNLSSQIESQKPVVQKFERFKRAAGDDQAAENTIALMELFQRGDAKALEMIDVLRNDLMARTGAVLTSPDLVKRAKSIDDQLAQGTIDETEASQRKSDLLEIQKSRVGQQQTEAQLKARDQSVQQQSFEKQQTELTNACNSWEKEKMASDPDYPSLKPIVEALAYREANARQQKLESRLLNNAEMRAVLDEALTKAKEQAAKLRPAPKQRLILPGNGSSATSRRAPANRVEEFNQTIDELESKRR